MESNILFVLVGSPEQVVEEITYVDNDNVKAAENATEYLINLGHQRVGYIGGDLNYEVSIARFAGIRQNERWRLHNSSHPQYSQHLGHQRVGYIGGDLNYEVSIARFDGFQQALRKHNIPLVDDYMVNRKTKGELEQI